MRECMDIYTRTAYGRSKKNDTVVNFSGWWCMGMLVLTLTWSLMIYNYLLNYTAETSYFLFS
jgi:hypothetical protein